MRSPHRWIVKVPGRNPSPLLKVRGLSSVKITTVAARGAITHAPAVNDDELASALRSALAELEKVKGEAWASEILTALRAAQAQRDEALRRQQELDREVTGLRNSYWEERKARLAALKEEASSTRDHAHTAGVALDDACPIPGGVPTYADAVAVVRHYQKPSCSLIQRKLQIGYNRAASFIEQMEAEGLVGKANSAGARAVLAPLLSSAKQVERDSSRDDLSLANLKPEDGR
jgi:hypothetical protein